MKSSEEDIGGGLAVLDEDVRLADIALLDLQSAVDASSIGFEPEADPIPEYATAAELTRIIFERYNSKLLRLAQVIVRNVTVAQDVVGDAYERIGRQESPHLRDPEKLGAYARRAVVNTALSHLRHQRVVEKYQDTIRIETDDNTSAIALSHVMQSELVVAVRALPERQREAIVLRYWGGLTETEIASAMKISRGAVKSHTARAMQKLKDAFDVLNKA